MQPFDKYVTSNKKEFFEGINVIAGALQVKPEWLLTVMYLESRINPAAQNPYNKATGLIQFINSTAKSLGTSLAELKAMSNVDQLDYVYKYYKPYKGRIKSFIDLYMITFFPVALGKPDNWVIEAKGISAKAVADGNKGYDLNKDSKITIGEFKQAVFKRLPADIIGLVEKKNL